MAAVVAGGIRIAYRRRGHGASLVLFHGAFEDSRVWSDTLDRLSPHADVVAWDGPGCGASDDVPAEWTDRDWADAAADFLRALHVTRPCVAGLSLGSVLALLLARDHPESLGSLVLVGAYAGWGGSLTPEALTQRIEATRFTLTHPVSEWADDFIDSVLAADAPPERRRKARALLDDWRPATTAAVLDVMVQDLRPALAGIRTPTVVVRGTNDARSPRQASLDIVSAMPHARLVQIPGAGHDCSGADLDAVLLAAAQARPL